MIGLAATMYDPLGHITMRPDQSSELQEITRRVSRAKTLDGSVVINDGGHSAGDRTMRVRWKIASANELLRVQRMVRLYSTLTLATPEGVFLVVPESCTVRGSRGSIGDLRLLVREQLA